MEGGGLIDLKRSDANGDRNRGCACPVCGFGFTDPAGRAEALTGVENGLLGEIAGSGWANAFSRGDDRHPDQAGLWRGVDV